MNSVFQSGLRMCEPHEILFCISGSKNNRSSSVRVREFHFDVFPKLTVVELSIKYLKRQLNQSMTHPILSCLLIGHCPQVHVYISGIFVICGNESCHS